MVKFFKIIILNFPSVQSININIYTIINYVFLNIFHGSAPMDIEIVGVFKLSKFKKIIQNLMKIKVNPMK